MTDEVRKELFSKISINSIIKDKDFLKSIIEEFKTSPKITEKFKELIEVIIEEKGPTIVSKFLTAFTKELNVWDVVSKLYK